MKQFAFVFFLVIILSIHFLVNYYIYVRGVQGFEGSPQIKLFFKWLMLFLFFAYPVGRFLEKVWISPVSDFMHWAGAFWFAGMLYSVLFLILVELTRLGNLAFHFLPALGSPQYVSLKLTVSWVAATTVFVIVLLGFINAWHPKTTMMNLVVDKKAGQMERLRIVAVSDIHMGTIIAKRKTAKMVAAVNALKPDIILMAGDVVDEDVQPVIRQNLGQSLLKLEAPLGVYAITGNHEFIGGVERTTDYLASHGLTLLRDTCVHIAGSFYVAGREDRDKLRFTGVKRNELDELLNGIDKSQPIILLDHQPWELDKAQQAGIDLQISGHTHHGQLWPWGYLTQKIFEVSRGYKQKGDSHFYVSTGYGTWGPPVRTGNRPEIMVFDLEFKQ